jgi:hypothetical protein
MRDMPRGLQKIKKTRDKKTIPKNNRPTSLLFFFFFLQVPLASLWTCHRMWAPAAGDGVFLYELVPSDDTFMWCLCETFFLRTFFFPPPKNKLSS